MSNDSEFIKQIHLMFYLDKISTIYKTECQNYKLRMSGALLGLIIPIRYNLRLNKRYGIDYKNGFWYKTKN